MFTIDQTALLDRIMSFPIDGDEPVAFPFVARLADENGWPRPFAERVVREYKRFVFLATTAGHPVTPSDEVDRAWHLHLTYTRSYWERFCGIILPRPLHHEPTRGGAKESVKFGDWYTRTLDSYRRFFEEAPPGDIWPAPANRFSQAIQFRRVNTAQCYLLPKRRSKRVCASAALVAVALCTIGASGDSGFMAMIWFGGFAFIVLIALARRISNRAPPPNVRRRQEGSSSTDTGSCGGLVTCGTSGTTSHTAVHSCGAHATSGPAEAGCSAGDGGAGGDAGCGASSGCGAGGCGASGCGGGGCGGGGCGGGCGG